MSFNLNDIDFPALALRIGRDPETFRPSTHGEVADCINDSGLCPPGRFDLWIGQFLKTTADTGPSDMSPVVDDYGTAPHPLCALEPDTANTAADRIDSPRLVPLIEDLGVVEHPQDERYIATVRANDLDAAPTPSLGATQPVGTTIEADGANVAPPDNPGSDERSSEAILLELSGLGDIEYARRRKLAARTLGCAVGDLDKMVNARRKKGDVSDPPHWEVDPWPAAVDTDVLLGELTKIFGRYIYLPKHAAESIALWVLHSWAFDAGDISPFLVLTSPTKRCGKTSALILLQWLTPRSELAANISPAAIFRYIEDKQPTLIIDEGDSFLAGNEEMRGILNSGHTKAAAHVIRTADIGGRHTAKRFSTWAPKVIACIGAIAGTLEDRAIIVRMQRKPPDARVERLRRRDCAEYAELRRQALRWSIDNLEGLRSASPTLPVALNDRGADNWEPLLAIAELAGPAWAERARAAALALSGNEAADEDEHGVELLRDIRMAFCACNQEAIFTKTLMDHLSANEERPWASFGRSGKPITDRQIAKLLGPFGIISGTVRIGEATAKGYKRADFETVWGVYFRPLPQEPALYPSQRHNPDETDTSSPFSSVTEDKCAGCEPGNLSNSSRHCDVVTAGELKSVSPGQNNAPVTTSPTDAD